MGDAARPQHAVELVDDGLGVGDVLQHVFADHPIYRLVIGRYPVVLHKLRIDPFGEPLLLGPLTRSFQEFAIDVQREYLAGAPDPTRQFHREAARTASIISNDVALADFGRSNQRLLIVTPLEHRFVARHAFGFHLNPVVLVVTFQVSTHVDTSE